MDDESQSEHDTQQQKHSDLSRVFSSLRTEIKHLNQQHGVTESAAEKMKRREHANF